MRITSKSDAFMLIKKEMAKILSVARLGTLGRLEAAITFCVRVQRRIARSRHPLFSPLELARKLGGLRDVLLPRMSEVFLAQLGRPEEIRSLTGAC